MQEPQDGVDGTEPSDASVPAAEAPDPDGAVPGDAAPFVVDGEGATPAQRFATTGPPLRSLPARIGLNLARLAVLGGVAVAVYLAQRSSPQAAGILAAPAASIQESSSTAGELDSEADTAVDGTGESGADSTADGGVTDRSGDGGDAEDPGARGSVRASGPTYESAVSGAQGPSESGPDQVDRTLGRGAFGTEPESEPGADRPSAADPDGNGDEAPPSSASTPSVGDGSSTTDAPRPTTSTTDPPVAPSTTSTTERPTTERPTTERPTTRPPTTRATTTRPPTTRPTTTTTRPTTTTTRPTTTTTRPTTTTTRPTTTAPPPPPPPVACEVQTQDGGSGGVEVKYRSQADFAPRFNFYRSDGSRLTDTSRLSEDTGDRVFENGLAEREWPEYLNPGFDAPDVYLVAAVEADGRVSEAISCSRVWLG